MDLAHTRVKTFNIVDKQSNVVESFFASCLLLDSLAEAFILLPSSLVLEVECESGGRTIVLRYLLELVSFVFVVDKDELETL